MLGHYNTRKIIQKYMTPCRVHKWQDIMDSSCLFVCRRIRKEMDSISSIPCVHYVFSEILLELL
jgi:hypothetical protein